MSSLPTTGILKYSFTYPSTTDPSTISTPITSGANLTIDSSTNTVSTVSTRNSTRISKVEWVQKYGNKTIPIQQIQIFVDNSNIALSQSNSTHPTYYSTFTDTIYDTEYNFVSKTQSVGKKVGINDTISHSTFYDLSDGSISSINDKFQSTDLYIIPYSGDAYRGGLSTTDKEYTTTRNVDKLTNRNKLICTFTNPLEYSKLQLIAVYGNNSSTDYYGTEILFYDENNNLLEDYTINNELLPEQTYGNLNIYKGPDYDNITVLSHGSGGRNIISGAEDIVPENYADKIPRNNVSSNSITLPNHSSVKKIDYVVNWSIANNTLTNSEGALFNYHERRGTTTYIGSDSYYNFDITQFDSIPLTNTGSQFYEFKGKITTTDSPYIRTDASGIFMDSYLNNDISLNWDFSTITNATRMFYNTSLNTNISHLNFQNVVIVEQMFKYSGITQPIEVRFNSLIDLTGKDLFGQMFTNTIVNLTLDECIDISELFNNAYDLCFNSVIIDAPKCSSFTYPFLNNKRINGDVSLNLNNDNTVST